MIFTSCLFVFWCGSFFRVMVSRWFVSLCRTSHSVCVLIPYIRVP